MAEPAAGRLINRRYRLESRLGEGSMGVVYRARDILRGNAQVALKLVSARSQEGAAKSRLRSEFHALTRLRHPNLVGVHDLGVDRETGRWFLTLEFVAGHTLADAPPCQGRDLADLAVPLLHALDFIHARGFVHADIKPENILLPDNGGPPRVADFGLAEALGGAGTSRGTLPYTAPEVLRGDAPGPASDLYSLGATLYRAAAGSNPFEGATPDLIIEGHLRQDPPFPGELLERLPPGFAVVLRRLLAKDPSARPRSGTEVIAAINDLLGSSYPAASVTAHASVLRRGGLAGRRPEVETFDARLAEIAAGRPGGVILLTGRAGHGRTRLAEELRTRAQMEGLLVATGTCQEGAGDPLDAAVEVLTDLTPLSGEAPPPALSRLLTGDQIQGEPAPADRFQMMEAAARLVRAAARVAPLVVILEDLHAASQDLLDLAGHLARGASGSPVLVLLTARTPAADGPLARLAEDLRQDADCALMELSPLDDRGCTSMIASLLATDDLPGEIGAALHQHTGGSPFLITEAVQGLLDSGGLQRGPDGAWRLAAEDLQRSRLPESPAEAGLLRLQELPGDERVILETLAVARTPLGWSTLARLLPEVSPQALEALLGREILAQDSTPDGVPAFRYSHAFVRDALYHRLAREEPARVADLHGQVARLLSETDGPGASAAPEIAQHLEAAGLPLEAAQQLLHAAERDESRLALEAACRRYRLAIDLLAAAGGSAADQARAWERVGDIHRRSGRPGEAAEAYTRAQAVPVPGQDEAQQARLLHKRAIAAIVAGDSPGGRTLASEALSLARRSEDQVTVAACENAIGMSHARQGDHPLAEEHYRRALDLRRQLDRPGDLAGSLANVGMVAVFQGRLQEGRELLQEALATYKQAGDAAGAALAINNLGLVAAEEGRLQEARERLEEAYRAYEELASLRPAAQALLSLAQVLVCLGEFHKAVELSQEAAGHYRRLGMRREESHALQVLGDARRECWMLDAAVEAHERGLALARRAGDPAQEAFCLCALALDHLARGDREAAAQALQDADARPSSAGSTRLTRRLERGRALLDLARGETSRSLATLQRLIHTADQEQDQIELLEVHLLKIRAQLALGSFQGAEASLDALQAGKLARSFPARDWERLRLRAAAQAGSGGNEAAAATRAAAREALARLTSRLPADYRNALERSPAATRLRTEEGETDTARVASTRFLDTMYDIIEALTSPGETPRMLERILHLAVDLLGAERGLILLFPEDGGQPTVAASRNVEEQETIADAITYSCQIVNEGRLGRSLVAADAHGDPRLRHYPSVALYDIRSVLCVPMRSRERVMGTVYLDSRSRTINFDDDDLRFLEAFAQHAATALDNKRMVRALEKENITLRETLLEKYSFANIVGRSGPMQEVFTTLRAVTGSSLPVLVLGESGTGKELVARALHYNGPRRAQAFLTENCAAFPETLLESQLFGHVRGAFTGAAAEQRGLFQEADGGTLFLDEIGEMSPALQARLTRVLETGEIRPVGGSQTLHVNVRVIAATHRDLEKLVAGGAFRRDLLYRLNVISIALPPLRKRREDIPLLVSHFLGELAREMGREAPGIDDGALEILTSHPWPGNVRQLRNEMSRLLVFRSGAVITADDVRAVSMAAAAQAKEYFEEQEILPLKELEKRAILRALEETDGDRTRAARLLKVGRATVFRKIKDYDLDV